MRKRRGSKAEHQIKMLKKAKRRQHWYENTPKGLVMANLSRNHPDYGMSPREHEAAKRQRENNS